MRAQELRKLIDDIDNNHTARIDDSGGFTEFDDFGNLMVKYLPNISTMLKGIEAWMHHTTTPEWPEDDLWDTINDIEVAG